MLRVPHLRLCLRHSMPVHASTNMAGVRSWWTIASSLHQTSAINVCIAKTAGGGPRALTAEGFRYADGRIDRRRQRWIGVRGEHTDPNPQVVVNTLVAVDIEGARPEQVLVTGSDFYASPRSARMAHAWLG